MLEDAIKELTKEIRRLNANLERTVSPSPTVEERAVDFIPAATVAEITSRTADDVKAMLRKWVAADPTRKEKLIPMFRETTGLLSLKEVVETNASTVYAKLEAALGQG